MAARVLSPASAISRAEPAVSAATIGLMPSLRMILRHWPSAWTWLSTVLMSVERRALGRQQLVAHRQEMLGDDVQAGIRHQVVDVGDAAGDRILDRDHAEIGLADADRREGVLEGRAGHGLVVRIDLARWRGANWPPARPGTRSSWLCSWSFRSRRVPVRILGCASQRRRAETMRARRASRSSGVSTPSGTLSTMATSMRMPASSARSCSSLSRFSSGEGGSATKRSSAARR